MGSALELRCRSCGQRSAHSVVATESKIFRWDDAATKYFKLQYGEDLAFRSRLRRCDECGETVRTAELSEDLLAEMVRDIQKLSQTVLANNPAEPDFETHLRSACEVVEEIFGGPVNLKLQNSSRSEFAALAMAMDEALGTLTPDEAAAARFALRLWGAPDTPPAGTSRSELISKLRWPKRSLLLYRFLASHAD